jgi:RNA polymerase sigma factor (TIGR02999 family)
MTVPMPLRLDFRVKITGTIVSSSTPPVEVQVKFSSIIPYICGRINPIQPPMDIDAATAPITELLRFAQQGDAQAEEYLFRAVFGHLRRLAAASLRRENGRVCLEPTELVNEAYLHLFGERTKDFKNRTHFLAVAARAMRCILIDIARKRKAAKREGALRQVTLDEFIPSNVQNWPERLLALEEVLLRLAEFDPRAAEIVELKVFLGSTDQEVSDIVGKSLRTVKRDWKIAKAWLQAELSPPSKPAAQSVSGAGNR